MTTKTATKTLPASLVELPASFPWNLRNFKADPYLGTSSVELTRDGMMVALVKNDGRGGGSEIEIWSRGDEDVFAREHTALKTVLADAKAQNLKYRSDTRAYGGGLEYLEFNEEHLADTLLAEGEIKAMISRGRNHLFAKTRGNVLDGKFHTLRKSAHLSEEDAKNALRRHGFEGALLWSRATHQWLTV